ncbi:MAG: SEC-C domain-containing protein, partial [Rhodoferax sp.]|nr:SEC-C domain-containing protein [Rhodoferax sp.]
MAKLGSKARPLMLRVQSEDRAYFVAATCAKHGWEYIMEIAPYEREDLGDLDQVVTPVAPVRSAKVERNGPCPCGSGKKYKKCCGSATADTRKAAQMAILCWNAAVLPGVEQRVNAEDSMRKLANGDPTMEQELLAIFEMMTKRKQRYFRDDDRVIAEYSITDREDGLHLMVKSTHIKPDDRSPRVPVRG